jgi:hypothetical protein
MLQLIANIRLERMLNLLSSQPSAGESAVVLSVAFPLFRPSAQINFWVPLPSGIAANWRD